MSRQRVNEIEGIKVLKFFDEALSTAEYGVNYDLTYAVAAAARGRGISRWSGNSTANDTTTRARLDRFLAGSTNERSGGASRPKMTDVANDADRATSTSQSHAAEPK